MHFPCLCMRPHDSERCLCSHCRWYSQHAPVRQVIAAGRCTPLLQLRDRCCRFVEPSDQTSWLKTHTRGPHHGWSAMRRTAEVADASPAAAGSAPASPMRRPLKRRVGHPPTRLVAAGAPAGEPRPREDSQPKVRQADGAAALKSAKRRRLKGSTGDTPASQHRQSQGEP